MNKAIFLDFDGVVLDSVDIKTEALRQLFSEYDKDEVEDLIDYHVHAGGVSRYKKFEYFYRNILGRGITKDELKDLGEKFNKLVREKVLQADFIFGILEFIKRHKNDYIILVVSGTPDENIKEVVKDRNLDEYFDGVHGSPPGKSQLLSTLIEKYDIDKSNSIFFGDAITDMEAAKDNDLRFILVKSSHNEDIIHECEEMIENFRDLNW